MENSERNFELEENQKEDAVHVYIYTFTNTTYDTKYSDTLVTRENKYPPSYYDKYLRQQNLNKGRERQLENLHELREPLKDILNIIPHFK